MSIRNAVWDAKFLAKLGVGLAALGAVVGGVSWIHFVFLEQKPVFFHEYLIVAWRVLTWPESHQSGLFLEFLLAAGAGAMAALLPFILFVKGVKK